MTSLCEGSLQRHKECFFTLHGSGSVSVSKLLTHWCEAFNNLVQTLTETFTFSECFGPEPEPELIQSVLVCHGLFCLPAEAYANPDIMGFIMGFAFISEKPQKTFSVWLVLLKLN